MFKGPAALTGSSTAVNLAASGTLTVTGAATLSSTLAVTNGITADTLTLSSGGKAVTSVSATAATTGSNDLILATEAFVLSNSSSGSVESITTTGPTTLAANTSYFISAGGSAVVATCSLPSGGSALAAGSIIRFFAENATSVNTITLTAASPIFNVAGGSVTTLVLDTNGQSLQFMFKSGALWLIGGGFTSSSSS